MEALLDAALAFVAEIVYQLIFELLAEVGIRVMTGRSTSPLVAAFGYTLVGGGLGAMSVLLWPELLIRDERLSLAHLLISPIVAGLVMAGVGALRRHRGQPLVRLDTFTYGWLFAASFAVVRLLLAS